MNLTYRSLATILKYDNQIPLKTKDVTKGYYASEADLVSKIKNSVTAGKPYEGSFKTIECYIMDIADDIAYSTFDIEDAFKAGFITPIDILNLDSPFHTSVSKRVSTELKQTIDEDTIIDIVSDLFKEALFNIDTLIGLNELSVEDLSSKEFRFLSIQYSDKYADYLANDGYTRSNFSSQLIDKAINAIEFIPDPNIPALSRISLKKESKIRIEILKQVAFQTQILSPKLKIAEYRGKEIVKKIFDALKENPSLLPYDIRRIYRVKDSNLHRYRIICDYISCMTDKYAIELYGRLTSETPATIFKPY